MLRKRLQISGWCLIVAAAAGSAYAAGGDGGHGPGGGGSVNVIVILGILTFAGLLTTFLLGWLMPKKRKALFPWHKRLGIVTLILAIIHGAMVLLLH